MIQQIKQFYLSVDTDILTAKNGDTAQQGSIFSGVVSHATHTINETAEIIRDTQNGRNYSAGLTQNTGQHAITLKNQMDSLAEEWMTNFAKEAKVLKEVLEQDLMTLKGQLVSYADNVKSQIQKRVEELRAAMAPYADSLDSESLKATLLQKSEDLRGSVEQSVKELQAQLEPYTAE
ncbi:apolipoprotein A-IV-like [Triplophysa rosa]|uniref:apolipoprotein A-IV-like n=1 Tax=Triplophysa rosa TaxID=992332 RepID=UPI002545E1D0|nr:apolipoprotein A-IV-like [Triplophysa rosa]